MPEKRILQKGAELAEFAGLIDPNAAFLLKADSIIQGWIKTVKEKAKAEAKKISKRTPKEIVTSCELVQSALPVSKALKAVHYGTLKIVFRVLPRMAEKFLVKEFADFAGKVSARAGIKRVAGKMIPFLGSIFSTAVGVFDAKRFYSELESEIHAVLGCQPNILEKSPMRFAVNELVEKVKERVSKETTTLKDVHTRKRPLKSGGDF